jgi:hypothetical protein
MQRECLPSNEVVSGFEVGWNLSSPREVLHEKPISPGSFSNRAADETLFEDFKLNEL